MNSIILSFFLVAMAMMIDGLALTREERRRRILNRDTGELIFKGDFVYQLYKLKGKAADPVNNLTITYTNKKYVYKDNANNICLMVPSASNPKKVLDVVGGIKCPFGVSQQLKFNETGFTIPAGRFFNRNFGIRRVKKYCSGDNFKLLQCQKEDFQRVMLLNARLTWDHSVWYNYHQFLHKHICICALLAKYDYFPYFTISYYGQCQGVERKGTPVQEGCVNGGYKQCMIGNHGECSGEEFYDALYEVNYDDYDFLFADNKNNIASDEVHSGDVHSDKVHSDEVRSNKIQSDKVQSDSDKKVAPIKKDVNDIWRDFQKIQNDVHSDEVHSKKTHSDEVQSDSDKKLAPIEKEVDDLLRDFKKFQQDFQYHANTP